MLLKVTNFFMQLISKKEIDIKQKATSSTQKWLSLMEFVMEEKRLVFKIMCYTIYLTHN
jgi:hypothetical protein